MSVVRVQASVLDIGSDVTIQRYSFFEILEIILHSCRLRHNIRITQKRQTNLGTSHIELEKNIYTHTY